MQFVRVPDLQACAAPLAARLSSELRMGKRVLWLVPGGSNIPLTVSVMHDLPDELTVRLTIMLTDERYGDVGHPDSNTEQLHAAGFRPKHADVIPVLRPNYSLGQTVKQYESDYATQVAAADIVIGQFGMGPDGHICGILPGSAAVGSADMTHGYDAGNFVRVTLTPKALLQVTAAYVCAFGEPKRGALTQLHDEELSLNEEPAQIIKQLPESYVYNDLIDDHITKGEN